MWVIFAWVIQMLTAFAVWELDAAKYSSSTISPSFTPFRRIPHNCQTVSSRVIILSLSPLLTHSQGKWVTILRAVWNPNPNVFPHFTVSYFRTRCNVYNLIVVGIIDWEFGPHSGHLFMQGIHSRISWTHLTDFNL